MNTRTRFVSALAFAATLTAAPATLAGDPFAPDYRGDPNSVFACFDWVTNNPPGDWALTGFQRVDDIYPFDMTAPSAFDNGQDVTVLLPNFIDPLPVKFMRIALYFDGAVDISNIQIQVNAFDPLGAAAIETFRTPGSANAHYIDFEIRPNPDWEEIFIFGSTAANVIPGNLLQIKIDTVSVPSPGSIGLFAAGSLLAVSRRRR